MPRALGLTSLQVLGVIRNVIAHRLDIVSQTGTPSSNVYPTPESLKKSGLLQTGAVPTTKCLVTLFAVLACPCGSPVGWRHRFLRDQE